MISNAKATHGLQEILSKFDDADLHILVATVTQGLLKNKVKDRQEAINAIIHYSSDIPSILRRKILTKEILFSYLHDHNIPVKLPLTKNDLIVKVAEFWNIPLENTLGPQQSVSVNACEQNYSVSYSNSNTNIVSNEYSYSEALVQSNASDSSIARSSSDTNVDLLAQQFVKWFFNMLNNKENVSDHFYPDARCKINWCDHGSETSKIIENNPQEINEILSYLKQQNDIFFNPNYSREGVQGRMNPHGLVMVLVCGTLHSKETCIGVFEQVFALAKDPFSDSYWKIKNTELNLRVKDVNSLPCLTDSDLTNSVLCSLPEN